MSRALLALWLLLCSSGARAEPEHGGTSPFAKLIPSADERVEARERRLEQKLGALLAGLSGVREARVALTLPHGAREPLDRALPETRVSVVLVLDGQATPVDDVPAAVRAAAPELEHAHVTVTHSRVPAQIANSEPLVSVGPFRVSAESARGLRVMLAVSLLANVLLATFLIVRLRRRSRPQRAY